MDTSKACAGSIGEEGGYGRDLEEVGELYAVKPGKRGRVG